MVSDVEWTTQSFLEYQDRPSLESRMQKSTCRNHFCSKNGIT